MVTFNGTQELFDSKENNMNEQIRSYILKHNPDTKSDEVFASPYTNFFDVKDWSKMIGLSLDGVGSTLVGGNYMNPMQRNTFFGYKYNNNQSNLNLVELFGTVQKKDDYLTATSSEVKGSLFGSGSAWNLFRLAAWFGNIVQNAIEDPSIQTPTCIHMNLTGWSRGGMCAIGATHSLKRNLNWLNKQNKTNIELKIDLFLVDPVYGASGSELGKKHQELANKISDKEINGSEWFTPEPETLHQCLVAHCYNEKRDNFTPITLSSLTSAGLSDDFSTKFVEIPLLGIHSSISERGNSEIETLTHQVAMDHMNRFFALQNNKWHKDEDWLLGAYSRFLDPLTRLIENQRSEFVSGNLPQGFIDEYKPTTNRDMVNRKVSNFAAGNHQRDSLLIFRDFGYYSFNAAHLALLYCSKNTNYHSILFTEDENVCLELSQNRAATCYRNNANFSVTWDVLNYYSKSSPNTHKEIDLYNQYFKPENSINKMWFLKLFERPKVD